MIRPNSKHERWRNWLRFAVLWFEREIKTRGTSEYRENRLKEYQEKLRAHEARYHANPAHTNPINQDHAPCEHDRP